MKAMVRIDHLNGDDLKSENVIKLSLGESIVWVDECLLNWIILNQVWTKCVGFHRFSWKINEKALSKCYLATCISMNMIYVTLIGNNFKLGMVQKWLGWWPKAELYLSICKKKKKSLLGIYTHTKPTSHAGVLIFSLNLTLQHPMSK